MFIVFVVLSFKTFISSVYSVTAIAMPLSILGISWSFMSSYFCDWICGYFVRGCPLASSVNEKDSMCLVLMANPIINWSFLLFKKIFFISIRLATGTVLKVSIWHRYRKKKQRYTTLLIGHCVHALNRHVCDWLQCSTLQKHVANWNHQCPSQNI